MIVIDTDQGDDFSFENAIERSRTQTTEAKFLPNLTLEQLELVSTDMLIRYAKKTTVIASLPDTNLAVFRQLLRRLPADLVGSIASTPGLLMNSSDEHIIAFANFTEAVERTSTESILKMVNSRPEIIPKLPTMTLDMFATKKAFVRALSVKTIKFLVHSPEFASKMSHIPRHTLAQLVTDHPHLLARLPSRYPARNFVQEILRDKRFLRKIPARVHAYIAETDFRHQIPVRTVKIILQMYPRLPALLSTRGMRVNKRYFRDQIFLNSLSCSVFLSLANVPTFVNRLAPGDLSAMARNRHLWSCLPVSMIRTLLKESNIGGKVRLGDVIVAAKLMSKTKSLDHDVVVNMLRYQFPEMARQSLKP